jgi:hypothetical protein
MGFGLNQMFGFVGYLWLVYWVSADCCCRFVFGFYSVAFSISVSVSLVLKMVCYGSGGFVENRVCYCQIFWCSLSDLIYS